MSAAVAAEARAVARARTDAKCAAAAVRNDAAPPGGRRRGWRFGDGASRCAPTRGDAPRRWVRRTRGGTGKGDGPRRAKGANARRRTRERSVMAPKARARARAGRSILPRGRRPRAARDFSRAESTGNLEGRVRSACTLHVAVGRLRLRATRANPSALPPIAARAVERARRRVRARADLPLVESTARFARV